MSVIKALLETFSRGETSFEALKEGLDSYLLESPDNVAEARRLLTLARERGLPHHVYVALSSSIPADLPNTGPSTAKDAGIQDQRTLVLKRGAGSDDLTEPASAVRPDPGASVDPDATVLASDDEDVTDRSQWADADATVLAGGEEEAMRASAGSDHRSGDADATMLADQLEVRQTPADTGPQVVAGDEATELNAAAEGSSEEATTLNPEAGPDDQATTLNTGLQEEEDRTAVVGEDTTDSGGFDILSPDAMDAAARAVEAKTGAEWPTAVRDRTRGAAIIGDRDFHAGDVLRQRFRLMSQLGEGGMGKVWKAVDLLKEEAKDRNPYVAIKLLSGDFREHPEAFIALQRESAKAQRLAHPNIATVFDFDRDGDTVYMTMEVLEGQPLDGFIRKLPAGGLPEDEAMNLIEQLAAGLSYAHGHQLVHSDLKPGNAFLTKEGTVKLLDFGIARASKTKDAEGETTVFDPGALGALTPAYATVEMFEGQDPDPRDDIYALGIIAYQLITGKHPYGKLSAPKAKEKGLVVAPVPKLDKRQNRGLARAVAFDRADRTPSVDEFLDDIRRRKSRTKEIAAASVAGVLLLGALAYQPVLNVLQKWESDELIAQILTEDPQAVRAAVDAVRTFDIESQRAVLDDERAKAVILELYRAEAEEAVDSTKGKYDYPEAEKNLAELGELYEDSAQVAQIRDQLETQKNSELAALSDRYNRYLDQGLLLPVKGEDDITEVLKIVKQIDPEHPLLKDLQLPIKYADSITAAIKAKDFRRADTLLETSLAFVPNDPTLLNLRYQVDKELQRQKNQATVAEIQQRLRSEWNSIKSLNDFRRVKNDLIRLEELSPESPVLAPLQEGLLKAFSLEMDRRINAEQWEAAEKLLADFAPLLEVPYLLEKRELLSKAEDKAGYRGQPTPQQLAAVVETKKALETLLAEPGFTAEWETGLKSNYRELVARLPFGDEALNPLRDKAARLYLGQARESRAANRFKDALALVSTGESFYPDMREFDLERKAIDAAEQALRRQQEEERRLARLNARKRNLITKAEADQVQEAKDILAELKRELPANDPFLVKDGPTAIGQAYQRLAERSAERLNFENAVTLAKGGLDVAPSLTALETLLSKYRKISDFSKRLKSGPLQVDTLTKTREEIKGLFPKRYSVLSGHFEDILEKRIKALERADPAAASELLAKAKRIFPIEMKIVAPSKTIARGLAEVDQGRLTAARKTLKEAVRKEPDHPDLPGFRKALEDRIAQAQQMYQGFLRFKKARRAKEGKPYLERASAFWSDNSDYKKELSRLGGTRITLARGQCSPSLAGYGQRAQGTCYDSLSGNNRGPLLVVVPAGGGVKKPFAIGKHEVSVSDYNLYCQLSGQCKPTVGKDPNVPVTDISFKQAQAYARWLSEQTKAVYRVPTEAEWLHAANAQGKQPAKDRINCRVVFKGQTQKGHALVPVGTGAQNAWGLKNYVGNAQEWVVTGSGVAARGGAFQDSLSNCDVDLKKAHSGQPDPVTSFRLLREMG